MSSSSVECATLVTANGSSASGTSQIPSSPPVRLSSGCCSGDDGINNSTNNPCHHMNGVDDAAADGYTIRPAASTDYAELLAFMLRDFLATEPLNAALAVTHDEAHDFFGEIVSLALREPGLSLVVRDSSAAGGQVIGMALCAILMRPSAPDQASESSDGNRHSAVFADTGQSTASGSAHGKESSKIMRIKHLLEHVESKVCDMLVQAWEVLSEAEASRLLSLLILSVDAKWTRRGIARRLIERLNDVARHYCCQGIITEATAYNSQHLFAKHGYRRLYEVLHAEWRDERDQPIFQCYDRTDRATLDYKPV